MTKDQYKQAKQVSQIFENLQNSTIKLILEQISRFPVHTCHDAVCLDTLDFFFSSSNLMLLQILKANILSWVFDINFQNKLIPFFLQKVSESDRINVLSIYTIYLEEASIQLYQNRFRELCDYTN